MEIVCDNCYTKLSVPDDKIPEGQRVGIKCPKCQNKVIVDLSSKAGADNTLDIDEFNGSTENTKEFGIDEEMEDLDLEFYGKDKKLALVLDSDLQRRQLITEIVSDLGYRPLAEEDSRKFLSWDTVRWWKKIPVKHLSEFANIRSNWYFCPMALIRPLWIRALSWPTLPACLCLRGDACLWCSSVEGSGQWTEWAPL
ncbi:MAG: zinc-ribbon domain-containing protein [Deltaproteobacteria bacterium]